MKTTGPGYSASTLVMLLLAVAFAAGGIAGVKKGWAYAAKSDFHEFGPWSPPVDLKMQMGWWNATASISFGKASPGFAMESKAAQSLGVITVILLFSSMLLSLYFLSLLSAEFCWSTVINELEVNKRRKFFVALICTVLLFLFSVGLYVALAIGLDHEVSKRFEGQHVFARPDWSFCCAFAAAMCWAVVCSIIASTMSVQDSYYYPLVV